jgi:hypothetical protein
MPARSTYQAAIFTATPCPNTTLCRQLRAYIPPQQQPHPPTAQQPLAPSLTWKSRSSFCAAVLLLSGCFAAFCLNSIASSRNLSLDWPMRRRKSNVSAPLPSLPTSSRSRLNAVTCQARCACYVRHVVASGATQWRNMGLWCRHW